jgi:hypothetical protein
MEKSGVDHRLNQSLTDFLFKQFVDQFFRVFNINQFDDEFDDRRVGFPVIQLDRRHLI